jgi:hypothetical protein
VQVDLAGEETKYGARPEEVPAIFDAAARCVAARVVGVMTLPPIPELPEHARPWFRQLQDLRQGWLAAGVPPAMLREVSMGMSGDFEVAVQEGATIVRVGRLFSAPGVPNWFALWIRRGQILTIHHYACKAFVISALTAALVSAASVPAFAQGCI